MRRFLSSGRGRYALLLLVVGAGTLAIMGSSCAPAPTKPPAPAAGLTIQPTGQVFMTVGEVRQFVVTNNSSSTTGTLTTTITNEPGTNPGDFTTSADGCNGNTLPGGNVCTLNVTLNASGSKAATLTVSDANDGAAVGIIGGQAP
jgi:hypothetical protein